MITFLAFLVACGGNTTTDEKKDTTQEAKDDKKEVEKKEAEPKFELTEDAKMIAKKWQMTEMTHVDKSKEKTKDNKFFLDLKPDGTYTEMAGTKTIETGKWLLAADKKSITFIRESGEFNGSKKVEEIKEFSATKLVTVDNDGKMTETFEPAKE
jgi:hypothetical protein